MMTTSFTSSSLLMILPQFFFFQIHYWLNRIYSKQEITVGCILSFCNCIPKPLIPSLSLGTLQEHIFISTTNINYSFALALTHPLKCSSMLLLHLNLAIPNCPIRFYPRKHPRLQPVSNVPSLCSLICCNLTHDHNLKIPELSRFALHIFMTISNS